MKSRILIVDDQLDHLRLLQSHLAPVADKYEVEVYDPIEQGMPNKDFTWSNYDLLLIDYYLRDNTAFEWLDRYDVLADFPPVIVISGVGDEKLAVKAIKHGAIDYLSKSELSADMLLSAIRNAIEEAAVKQANYQAIKDAQLAITQHGVDRSQLRECHQPGYQPLTAANTINKPDDAVADLTSNWPFTAEAIVNGSARIGDYLVTDYIGTGGMSTVFKAKAAGDPDPVVIKLLNGEITDDETIIQRFAEEYVVTRRINHPNVIKVYSQGHSDDYSYIVMEYLPYGDLAKYIRQGIGLQKAMTFATQMTSALVELHRLGVVHRDLKPHNILFRDPKILVLADFGIAKQMIKQSSGLTLTQTGMMVGTLAYASPEQITTNKVDSRSDQYNLGLILYEMLVGQKPFTGKTAIDIAMKHVSARPPLLPDEFSFLQPLMDRLLAKQPDKRFDHIDEVLAEMLQYRLNNAVLGF
jgi:FixJ family two-component response regulator